MIQANKLIHYVERCETKDTPVTAEIFLTEFCNLKCSYCRYSNDSGKSMGFADFVTYVNRLRSLGVRGIILTGGGEPTVNPYFGAITGWLEGNGIPYGVNTNLVKPIDCNANFIKVSIDASGEDEYERIRGKRRFHEVLSNVEAVVSAKKRHGRETKIGVQCVALEKSSILGFYNAVKHLDVYYIYIRPLEIKGSRKTVSRQDVEEALKGIEDPRLNVSFKFDLAGYMPSSCHGNWSVITIDVDGNVPYCCHRPNEIVGHILDPDIMAKKRDYAVDMRTCETPCRLSGVNRFLEDPSYFESDNMFL